MQKNKKHLLLAFTTLLIIITTFFYTYAKQHYRSYTKISTIYEKEVYNKYSHGPDGAIFVDLELEQFIKQHSKRKKIIDIGCGKGELLITAANQGAKKVVGIDIQRGMIDLAKKNILKSKHAEKIELYLADGSKFNNVVTEPASFDIAYSILVCCNIPSTNFENHFKEIYQALKINGKACIVAPYSLDVLFVKDNVNIDALKQNINHKLKLMRKNPKEQNIIDILRKYDEILSATFALDKNNKLFLVNNLNKLKEGQRIWRKLPNNIVIPNYYHSNNSYLQNILSSGLKIYKISKNHFKDKKEKDDYNSKQEGLTLGEPYVNKAPFIIYFVEK